METTKLTSDILFTQPIYQNNHSTTYLKDGIYYKVFNNYNESDIDIMIEKILKLNDLGILDQVVLGSTSDKGVINGYKYTVGDYDYSKLKPLDSISTSKKDKIEDLDNLKIKLDQLHQYNIVHGDLRLKNILTGKNKTTGKRDIIFKDLDNVSIDSDNFGYSSYQQKRYINKLGIDTNLDNMMYNIAVISYLANVIEAHAIDYVREFGLPRSLNSSENKEIIETMIKLDRTKKIELLNYKKRH